MRALVLPLHACVSRLRTWSRSACARSSSSRSEVAAGTLTVAGAIGLAGASGSVAGLSGRVVTMVIPAAAAAALASDAGRYFVGR